MPTCLFASDLHGNLTRYRKLLDAIKERRPDGVFLGGDLLPGGLSALRNVERFRQDFVSDFLVQEFNALRELLGSAYPRVFVILGNDDSRTEEAVMLQAAARGVWEYVHNRRVRFGAFDVYGYAIVPPTPFMNKDWELYDVSQYVEPGCVSPEEGMRSVPVAEHVIRYATIKDDLDRLCGKADLSRAILLFHAPPYDTNLDRAALDGRMIDYAPVRVHVGSVAIRRLIETRRPRVTLHGHIHESARLIGDWKEVLGDTYCFTAAHDGPELALVQFDPDAPERATRELL